jgi:carboxylesterase type B
MVTIFGQSAGALSIATLLSMPRAKGLAARDLAGNAAVPIDLAVPGFGIPDRLGSIID